MDVEPGEDANEMRAAADEGGSATSAPSSEEQRLAALRASRAARLASGLPPFADARLTRADVAALIAVASSDPHDDSMGATRADTLDFRAAILSEVNLSGLNLSDAQFGPANLSAIEASSQRLGAHVERARFVGCDLRGATLNGAHLAGADLTRARLTHARMRFADLTGALLTSVAGDSVDAMGATLMGANLEYASLTGVTLREANLSHAHLPNAHLDRASLESARCEGTDFSLAHLRGANFTNAHLELARLPGADLARCILAYARLAKANLTSASLQHAVLDDADLTRARLIGADLSHAHLAHATLTASMLPNAVLRDADVRWSKLRGAVLMSANLTGANLGNADLTGADLRRTRLTGTILTGTRIDGANLGGARCDHDTHMPVVPFADVLLYDVHWGGAHLSEVPWQRIHQLGDERMARNPRSVPLAKRPLALRRAAKAYRELAISLGAQGEATQSADYHYREQLMERWSLLYEVANRLRLASTGTQPDLYFDLRQRLWRLAAVPLVLGRWLVSFLLGALCGYGNKPARAFAAYVFIIAAFACLYYASPHQVGQPLDPVSAIVLSVTSFHGRGFFPQDVHPYDPLAVLAALEAVIGMFIELLFISAFTRRLFGS